MFVVVPKAQAERICKALARLEGLPRRAVVMRDGAPDLTLTEQLGAQLDTTDCVDAGDEDGTSVCIELPAELEKHLGKTVKLGAQTVKLPTLSELVVDEKALPETLRTVRNAKRLDPAQALPVSFPGGNPKAR